MRRNDGSYSCVGMTLQGVLCASIMTREVVGYIYKLSNVILIIKKDKVVNETPMKECTDSCRRRVNWHLEGGRRCSPAPDRHKTGRSICKCLSSHVRLPHQTTEWQKQESSRTSCVQASV